LELSSVHDHVSIEKQMTSITCYYRLAGSSTFIAQPMTTTVLDRKTLTARAVLPAFPVEAKGPVEYYFDFRFSGVHNQRGSPTNPISVPLR
jgi:hypothetical protein